MCISEKCSSSNLQKKYCDIDLDEIPDNSEISSVKVKKKYSRSPCTFNVTYGFSDTTIWVNKGCRAKFKVCFQQIKSKCYFPKLNVYLGWKLFFLHKMKRQKQYNGECTHTHTHKLEM